MNDYEQALNAIIVQRDAEIARLRDLLNDTDDALYWLLNLINGNSRGGPEYNPPSRSEFEMAELEGKQVHDRIAEWRKTQRSIMPFEITASGENNNG